MQENEKISEELDENKINAEDYIGALNELKQNSISLDKFNELQEENKKLLNALANGDYEEKETNIEDTITEEELIRELSTQEMTNLDFAKKTLLLREKIKDRTGEDCFVGKGHNYTSDENEKEKAENVAMILQTCIDNCDNDSNVFNALFSKNIKEDSALIKAKLKNKG